MTRTRTLHLKAHALRLAGIAAVLLSLLAALAPAGSAAAAPAEQGAFARGTVVALTGTPHLWFADAQGTLHWGGDTRALAGHDINWNSRVELSLDQLKALPLGDPWLSAGLLKDGDPIYLVKWETNQATPTLLHIQSIADVQLFGINGTNYGQFVLDRAAWEQRYGMSAAGLTRAELPSAAPAAPATPSAPKAGQVLVSDNFDDPSKGVLPTSSSDRVQRGYAGGEYFLKSLTNDTFPVAVVPGTYGNAALAVDAHVAGDSDMRLVALGCRSDLNDHEYVFLVYPAGGKFKLVRSNSSSDLTTLVDATSSSAIHGGTQTNHLELSCSGSTIAVRINGTQVASVQDSTYHDGHFWIGALTTGSATVEARFDNLVVTQQ